MRSTRDLTLLLLLLSFQLPLTRSINVTAHLSKH
jgi:hypothetical protein